ncbi:MAG: 16S rRNA (uracil(1498)-N(3))-methyltransferase [Peptococcaceae bacterium]|nr:16S rRNA (uracil(1498)-N(3))-methyltransferase [Peptococcaceae bacterium]
MHRFRIEPADVQGDELSIRDQEAHHLYKVLRLVAGEQIVAFDNSGLEYRALIQSVTDGEVRCQIIAVVTTNKEAPLDVYLVQGLPKADKMELIIQKTTELGIKGLYPVRTSRAIVQLEGKKAMERVERWQKIAAEAAKQCGRSVVPSIQPVMSLGEALKNLPPMVNILACYEAEATQGLKRALETYEQGPIAIVVGPEGGFTEQEIELLRAQGAMSISLGPRILRTETAGLAALTMVLYELADLGSPPTGIS